MTSSRKYSREEVQAILARALDSAHEQGDDLSHEDLLSVARELGVSESAIQEAAANIDVELAVKRDVDERIRGRRRGFVSHLIPFIMVNAVLASLNFMIGGPLWFLFPLLLWGIGLVFHARAAFLPDRKALEKRSRKHVEREREREARRNRRKERGTGEIEAAVQDVVASAIGAVADAISEGRRTRRETGVRVDVKREREGVRVDDRNAAARERAAEEEAEDESTSTRASTSRRRG